MNAIDEAIISNDLLPQHQRRSNRAIAKELGVSESSIRRHRRSLNKRGENRPVDGDDVFFGLPTGSITKRGKTIRLPDGSYEKIEWRPGAVELEEAKKLAYGDIEHVFDSFGAIDLPADPKAATKIICLSDFQVGKVDELGGSEKTIKRVADMLNAVASRVAEAGGYEEIILADLGDSTEGFGNTVAQAQTNDLSITDQIRVILRLYAEAIKLFAPLCKRLWFVSVPSNHCAVRTGVGSKTRANAPDDDFGLLVSSSLQLVVEGREELGHVSFAAPQKWEEALTLESFDGTCVGFTHGHLAGSQSKVASWFSDMAFGHRSGLHEASVLVHGHFHNFGVSLTGDNRFVVSAPTADNGSSWFSNSSGVSSEPALLSFDVADKRAQNWELKYAS